MKNEFGEEQIETESEYALKNHRHKPDYPWLYQWHLKIERRLMITRVILLLNSIAILLLAVATLAQL